MADRTVRVNLVAHANDYIRGMDEAARKTRETGSEAQKLSQKREGFEALGKASLAVGVAIVGIGAAALKTGIQYNTLQQTTRAALTTLLGSAEAANAQMDKLDAFARTSPFSKAVFITAQQQLLGFGMAADKVLPTLDAIQNAVAATGGSNADIAELVRIVAQLAGGVKISAETFNQFGARGIDAAQLIGDAMGKTGAQIRDEVTKGTLDADTAIQALTDGMATRFAGASANVKNTFEGAVDRVKAAWRDFSSELAKPLVDPNGGGALIGLLNTLADLMRGFQALPDPIKTTVTFVTGFIGVTALAMGTVILALPKFQQFRTSIQSLGMSMRGTTLATAGVTAALTVATAIIAGWISRAQESAARTEALADSLDEATGATTRYTRQLVAKRLEEEGAFDAALKAGVSQQELTDAIIEGGDALEAVRDKLHDNYDATLQWDGAMMTFRPTTTKVTQGLFELEQELRSGEDAWDNTSAAIGDTEAGAKKIPVVFGDVSAAAKDTSGALEELTEAVAKFNDQQFRADDAMFDFKQTLLDLEELMNATDVDKFGNKFSTFTGTLDLNTQEGIDNSKMLREVAASANAAAAEILELTGDQEGANAVLNEARARLSDVGAQFGLTGDELQGFIDKYVMSPKDLTWQMYLDGLPDAETMLRDFQREWDGRMITMRMFLDSSGGNVAAAAQAARLTAYAAQYGRRDGGAVGMANGGAVSGFGGPRQDNIPIMASSGEHMLDATDVRAMGGQSAVYQFRESLHSAPARNAVSGGQSGAPASVSLAGATLVAEMDGVPFRLMIRDQIVSNERQQLGRAFAAKGGGH